MLGGRLNLGSTSGLRLREAGCVPETEPESPRGRGCCPATDGAPHSRLQNINGETTVGRCQIRTQRIILEGVKPAWYQCSERERFRLGLDLVKRERRKLTVGKKVADMVEYEASKPKPPPPSNMMHPDGSRRVELDMLACVATMLVLVLAPMAVSFDVQATWAEWFLLVSTSCDAILLFDAYTRFFSGFAYLDAFGEWQIEDRALRCRLHYLGAWQIAWAVDAAITQAHAHGLLFWVSPNRKAPSLLARLPALPQTASGGHRRSSARPGAGWFWLDLITSFPAELFLTGVRLPADPYYRMQAVARIGGVRTFLRVTQGAKVLRVWRLHDFLNALQRSRSTRLFGTLIIKMVVYAALWAHWVACLWFAALRSQVPLTGSSAAPSTNSSVRTTPPPARHRDQTIQGLGAAAAAASGNSTSAWWTCDDREKLLGSAAGAGGRYLCALHWATQTMLAVGMGDVPLLSTGERVLAIVAMPLGLAVAISVTAAIGALLPGAPHTQAEFVARVRRVVSFLKGTACGIAAQGP